MRLARVPVFLLLIVVIGLVVLVSGRSMLMLASPSPRQMSIPPNAEVFVAGRTIPVGAVIREEDLATISLPQDKVISVEFAADQRAQLVGKVAKFPLEQGTVITSAMVGESSAPVAGPQWATANPPNPQSTNPLPTSGAAALPLPDAGGRHQMVIKNGELRLLVKDTDQALDAVSQIVSDTQGYVISSRVWYQDYGDTNYKYASLTMGVRADLFESAVRRLRNLGIRVLDDNASGQDVTEQYVDLQSHLTNLEATRDRIKSFLDHATTVDEALRINQQLSEVEAQIEQIRGQMNYLSNRSAFSTITVNLEPNLPKIVVEPTPTATPIAALGPWDPGQTTRTATNTLLSAYRVVIDFLIWFFLVIVPVLGPPVLLVWLVRRLIQRRQRAAVKGQEA